MNRLIRPFTLLASIKPQKLLPSKRPLHLSPHLRQQLPKTPDLIYMPHLIRWIKTKVRFKYLKKMWDPEFSEGAFIYGSTHAVCRITQIINNGQVEELEGLLTESARLKLVNDITSTLTQTQKSVIRLNPCDIKIFIPMSVELDRARVCKVNLRVLALKWLEHAREVYKLVLVVLQTEFQRDYKDGAVPDWTISAFQVLECGVLTETPAGR